MADRTWFVLRDEREEGPFSQEQIWEAAISGDLHIGDLLRAENEQGTVEARKVVRFPEWYFLKTCNQRGPITPLELKIEIRRGRISEDDLLRRSDTTEWCVVSSICGVMEVFSPLLEGCVEFDEENQLTPDSKWFWLAETEKEGPLTTAYIKELVEEKVLCGNDLLLHPERHFWMSIDSLHLFDKEQLLSTFRSVMGRREWRRKQQPIRKSARILTPSTTIEASYKAVSCLAFSPDSNKVATGSFDRCVRLWDVPSGKIVANFHPSFDDDVGPVGHSNTISQVAFSPDGSELASSSWDGTVCVWDITAQKQRHILEGHEGAVNCVAYLRDNKLWNTRTEPKSKLATAFDSFLVSAGVDGTIRLWNTATGQNANVVTGLGPISQFFLDPDGEHLWLAVTPRQSPPHYFVLCDLTKATDAAKVIRQVGGIRHVAASNDERYAAVSSADGRLRVWDMEQKLYENPHHNWQTYQGELMGVAFSPDSHLLASAGSDGTVNLRNPATGELLAICEDHEADAYDVVFSSDGRWLASCGKDGKALIWNMAEFKKGSSD